MGLFDILGYKDIILKRDLGEVFRMHKYLIDEYLDSIEHIDGLYTIGHGSDPHEKRVTMRAYSDTILFFSSDISNRTNDEIDRIFDETLIACDFLFMAAETPKLALRGAITVGDLIDSENIFVSKEIIEAYEMEKKQNWAGCWISKGSIDCISKEALEELEGQNLIILYDIPLKCNNSVQGYAWNWPKSREVDNCGIIKGMKAMIHRDDVSEKYENTIKFIQDVKDTIV
jgi:hypothetical protein